MKIEYYQGAAGWFWRLRAANGRIIADGAESYTTRGGVKRAANRIAWMIEGNTQAIPITQVKGKVPA